MECRENNSIHNFYLLLSEYVFYDILKFSTVAHLILNKYYIYIYTHTHTHKHRDMYVCVCAYELKPELLLRGCAGLSLENNE